MKKSLILASLLALGSWQTGMADDESLVLNVDFTSSGITVEKGAATNTAHTYGSRCAVTKDAIGHYLGSTYVISADNNTYDGSTKNFYYINYDKSDPVGQAFGNSFTFETVFRLDKIDAAKATTWTTGGVNYSGFTHDNTVKIIGTQEDGGWSLIQNSTAKTGTDPNYILNGISPQIAIFNDAEGTTNSNCNMVSQKYLNQGTFYHVVFTYDGPTHRGTVFVNGVKYFDGELTKGNDGKTKLLGTFKYPNCGYGEDGDAAGYRAQQMFIILGGDAAKEHTPTQSQNPACATFKYVKVYNTVKDADGVAALYDNDVKRYTEPEVVGQCLTDVQFDKDGGFADKTAYSWSGNVTKTGTITTQANDDQKRYEMCCTGSNANFLKWFYGNNPTFTKALADGYSIEVYAKGTTDTRADIICPMSGQQAQAAPGLEIRTDDNVVFNAWAKGFAGNSHYYYSQYAANITWTGGYTGGEYKHYVVTFKGGEYGVSVPESKLYVDGTLVAYASNDIDGLNGNEHTEFSPIQWQWIAIGGDANATDGSATCDFPWNGEISIARVWNQPLSASDVALLNTQAHSPATTVTVGSTLYATTCLPYNATVPAGITAYIATKQNISSVTLTKYAEAGDVMFYGTPVILIADAAGDYTFTPALDATLSKPHINYLIGTMATKTVGEGEYFVLTEDEGRANLHLSDANLAIPANKAILKYVTTFGAGSKEIVINPDPTAINRVDAQDTPNNSYYNLQGQKVEQPSRGIFIQNGKKVFIK